MILLIDNYDSFVQNLARYLRRLGQDTLVVRNDQIDMPGIAALQPQAIVLSPGPCTPQEAGCSLELVRTWSGRIPLLGVCLGHQTIGAAWGGKVVRAAVPMHGRTSYISHDESDVFEKLPQPLKVCRYHSLILEEATLPQCLRVTARTAEGEIMAVAHIEHKTFGVQFHPEAVLTEGGYQLLTNFLTLANIAVPGEIPNVNGERPPLVSDDGDWSQLPLTF
jgi:anthranilate synthase/aminodeoxychorismate synthase-like glutamine amidotransferase